MTQPTELLQKVGRAALSPEARARIRAELVEHERQQRRERSRSPRLAWALALFTVGGTALAAVGYRFSESSPTEVATVAPVLARPSAPSPAPVLQEVSAAEVPAIVVPAAPAPKQRKRPQPAPVALPQEPPPVVAAQAEPTPPASVVTEEDPSGRLVLSALQLLRREKRPGEGDALLVQYLQERPTGALVEEALALRMEAAVMQQRGAESRAREYLARFPRGRFSGVAERLMNKL